MAAVDIPRCWASCFVVTQVVESDDDFSCLSMFWIRPSNLSSMACSLCSSNSNGFSMAGNFINNYKITMNSANTDTQHFVPLLCTD